MMSVAYTAGCRAGRRRLPPGSCPFEGHSEPSMQLQLRWMTGYFDGLTQRRRPKRRVFRRKAVRRVWPKSAYARERLREALQS